jgi:nucleoside-diphosphate-sugar epimerase
MKEDLFQLPRLQKVAIIGASGFIGQHLIRELIKQECIQICVLVHQTPIKIQEGINYIEGDLLKLSSLDNLLSEDSIVINLAYLPNNSLQAMKNLAISCEKNSVKRLIHCSTAVVVGSAQTDFIREDTTCRPTSEYQISKLAIENNLLKLSKDKFELTILRPTAVFGDGGKNLLKLVNGLINGNMLLNYSKSCMYGHRSMNLVSVENVVSALIFLMNSKNVDREIFIISDDDAKINNYRDVEDTLLKIFDKSYCLPRVPIPKFILTITLRVMGKLSISPYVKFSDKKLCELGHKKTQAFDQALSAFAKKCNFLHSTRVK